MNQLVTRRIASFACAVFLCGLFFIPAESAAQDIPTAPPEIQEPEATPPDVPADSTTGNDQAPDAQPTADAVQSAEPSGDTCEAAATYTTQAVQADDPMTVSSELLTPQGITWPARIIDVFPDEALARIMAGKLGKPGAASYVQLAELVELTDLTISYSDVISLRGIGYLNGLKKLQLLYNDNMQPLPQEMDALTALGELRVAGCPSVGAPAGWIGSLTALTRLEYTANGATSVPDELANLVSLKSLDLSGNPLANIPSVVFSLHNLEELSVSDTGLAVLPPEIGQLTNLSTLHLQKNALRTLPSEIGSLRLLEEFYLTENELESIPVEFGTLASLTGIHISYNNLSCLPAEIYLPAGIETINVSHNNLTEMPDGLGSLSRLRAVYLNDNRLSLLPAGIENCESLESLYASNNALDSLPRNIGRLDKLAFLYLSGNNLSEIPVSIGNCRNLRVWHVDDNLLSTVPSTVVSLAQCYEFSARNNRIGVLPALGNLGYENLYLSGNRLADIHTLAGGRIEFDARDQTIEISDYEKNLSFPLSYNASWMGTILWDRGSEQNEVQSNELFSGTSFRMDQNYQSFTLEGPSGTFSVHYTIKLADRLEVINPDIIMELGEVFLLDPQVVEILPQHQNQPLTFFYNFPEDQEVFELFKENDFIWIRPLSGGTTFLTIRAVLGHMGTADGEGSIVEGETTIAVQVDALEVIVLPAPLTLNTRGLENGNIAYLGRPFMIESSDIHKAGPTFNRLLDDEDDPTPFWAWSRYHFSAKFDESLQYYGTFTPKMVGKTTVTYFDEVGQQASISITIVDPYQAEYTVMPTYELPKLLKWAGKTKRKAPKTGDSLPSQWMALILPIAGGCLSIAVKKRRKIETVDK